MTSRPDNAVLRDAEAWQKERTALRDRLQNERTVVVDKLREIDTALEKLEDDTSRRKRAHERGGTPNAVREILREYPTGTSAARVIRDIQRRFRGAANVDLVHSVLYRMKMRGEVTTEGAMGHTMFKRAERSGR